MKNFFKGKRILITGGTGSFGQACAYRLLKNYEIDSLVVLSRDEWKQWKMREDSVLFQDSKVRYFLGDVRDKERLQRAFQGVDCVIHSAALKQVETAEYNPAEFVKTNVIGGMNVIEAAIDAQVSHVIALSTDKSVDPTNLYGATKLCSDKLFVGGNVYVGKGKETKFSVVRYGNVAGSRGSILPKWQEMITQGAKSLPITDLSMTRFWMSLDKAVDFVLEAFSAMRGGEIFIPKIPSIRIVDLAEALCPGIEKRVIGLRPGEKLHELLIGENDARSCLELNEGYILVSEQYPISYSYWLEKGRKVPEKFVYASDTNSLWLDKHLLHTQFIKEEGYV